MSLKETAEPFDEYADRYEQEVAAGIAFAGVEHDVFLLAKARVLLQETAATVGDPALLSMLDVGSGVGAFATHLVDHVGAVEGVDTSAVSVARARERVPKARFASYDGGVLPYDTGRFDVAFAVCVFHHVNPSERAELAAEMTRVVRPGGMVAILEHNPWNPLTRLVVSRIPFDDGCELLPLGESRGLLEQAGARSVWGRYLLFLPSASATVNRFERMVCRLPFGAQYGVFGIV